MHAIGKTGLFLVLALCMVLFVSSRHVDAQCSGGDINNNINTNNNDVNSTNNNDSNSSAVAENDGENDRLQAPGISLPRLTTSPEKTINWDSDMPDCWNGPTGRSLVERTWAKKEARTGIDSAGLTFVDWRFKVVPTVFKKCKRTETIEVVRLKEEDGKLESLLTQMTEKGLEHIGWLNVTSNDKNVTSPLADLMTIYKSMKAGGDVIVLISGTRLVNEARSSAIGLGGAGGGRDGVGSTIASMVSSIASMEGRCACIAIVFKKPKQPEAAPKASAEPKAETGVEANAGKAKAASQPKAADAEPVSTKG